MARDMADHCLFPYNINKIEMTTMSDDAGYEEVDPKLSHVAFGKLTLWRRTFLTTWYSLIAGALWLTPQISFCKPN